MNTKKYFFTSLLFFSIIRPLYSMESLEKYNRSSFDLDTSENNFSHLSGHKKEFLTTPLPEMFNNLSSLMAYAENYIYYADYAYKKILLSAKKIPLTKRYNYNHAPHFNILTDGMDSSYTRINDIMLTAAEGFGIQREQIKLTNFSYLIIFPLSNYGADDSHKETTETIKNIFHNYLLINNTKLLPDYKQLLLNIFENIDNEVKKAQDFAHQIEMLSLKSLRKLFLSNNFSEIDRYTINQKLKDTLADYI